MSAPHDVMVIGAGVVGACCADELAGRGADVVVLERGSRWGEGCSWGNAGLIVPSHARPIAAPEALRSGLGWMLRRDSPFGLRLRPRLAPWLVRYARAATAGRAAAGEALQRELARESLGLFRALEDAGVDAGFVQDGCITVFTGPDGPAHAGAEAASETGRALGARVLTAAQTRELEPALGESVTAGVLFPDEGRCDPVRFVPSIGERAVSRGAALRTGIEVRGLRSGPDGVVAETDHGEVRAATAVLAAGAWSGRLARTLGVRLPLQGGKGYAVEYAPDAIPLRRPVYLHDARCVATPLGDRVRMTGGLVLDGLDERFDPRRVDAIRRAAADVLGAGDSAPQRTWSGLRPCTPDGLPAIGRHPRAPGVVFATGHGMLGVTLGPLTARMVAGVLDGEAGAVPRELLPDRF